MRVQGAQHYGFLMFAKTTTRKKPDKNQALS
jgi:hypothetical protein